MTSATTAGPTFTADREGTYVLSLVVNDGRVASTPDEVTITATRPNVAPVANAGPDQLVPPGATVTLDGSGSTDADGDTLTYAWVITSVPVGSVATLSNASAAAPTFTADFAGSYVLNLSVNDGRVSSAPDEVVITAGNVPPVANAGRDQSVLAGWVVTLDGSGSSDANGDPLTRAWTITSKPAGSAAALSNAAAVAPTFTADLPGTYALTLIVNDGQLASAPDTATITAVVAAHVADTGQTVSYAFNFGEDADYATRSPSFTDNGDGTVTDNVTGLVWQQADDATWRTWGDAKSYCASLQLPGSGWRLPSPFESMTLMLYGKNPPVVNTTYFSATSAYYWTSFAASTAGQVFVGDYWNGGMTTLVATGEHLVRCLRGDPLGFAFVDNGDGTVTDAARYMTWQQADDGVKRNWYDSLDYCEGLTLGGFSDWRLPNVKELASIASFSEQPAVDLAFFPTTKQGNYWSSTSERMFDGGWQASFLTGEVTDNGGKNYATDYVRCVRGQ